MRSDKCCFLGPDVCCSGVVAAVLRVFEHGVREVAELWDEICGDVGLG